MTVLNDVLDTNMFQRKMGSAWEGCAIVVHQRRLFHWLAGDYPESAHEAFISCASQRCNILNCRHLTYNLCVKGISDGNFHRIV